MEVRVDGKKLVVDEGTTILDACDIAGCYVPRLCYHPGVAYSNGRRPELRNQASEVPLCGLCAVRLGDGSVVPACVTKVAADMEITTDDPGLRAQRLERLALILARHPHVCLSCPERDGCSRDECTYGIAAEARCCSEFGHCELGRLVAYLDESLVLPRTPVETQRDACAEGRIRREPGLCVACGRCVRICSSAPEAGDALKMGAAQEAGVAGGGGSRAAGEIGLVALPKRDTLRASGCTFCGLCVMVCPTGAVTAPGEAGARWLAGRRERSSLKRPSYPPERREAFAPEHVGAVPREPGVFRLFDDDGRVLRISGVGDLRQGLIEALGDPATSTARFYEVELDQMYTQRESELLARYTRDHGRLPPGNDLADDLFAEEEE